MRGVRQEKNLDEGSRQKMFSCVYVGVWLALTVPLLEDVG
jgi:hypothetical protein